MQVFGGQTEARRWDAARAESRRTEDSRRESPLPGVGQTRQEGRWIQGRGLSLGEKDTGVKKRKAVGKGTTCHFKGICADQV